MADDPRIDQLLGETLQLMADSGLTTSASPTSIGKFAAQYHERMAKVLPAIEVSAPLDSQALIELAVQKAVQSTLEALLSLHIETETEKSKVLTVFPEPGRKTSVSVSAELYKRLVAKFGPKEVTVLANAFARQRPAGSNLSRWVSQNLENQLILRSLPFTESPVGSRH